MFTSDEFFEKQFATCPVMAILRGYSVERTLELCSLAWSLGITLVEIPLQNSDSLMALKESVLLATEGQHPVGAGTVVSVDLARQAHELGAAFTVAPGFAPDVAAESIELGLPHLPGVATATDVQTAERHGFNWQKMFPASLLGSGWISAMKGPFPRINFVATGGADVNNAQEFLDVGAAAVSLGSSFENGNPDSIRNLSR